jgi:hypothetical protein
MVPLLTMSDVLYVPDGMNLLLSFLFIPSVVTE